LIVYTDNTELAESYLLEKPTWGGISPEDKRGSEGILIEKIFLNRTAYKGKIAQESIWKYLLITEYSPFSQYDKFLEMIREKIDLPNGILCLADSGDKFHGQKNRRWKSLPGNIHLSAFLSPQKEVERFNIGFTIMSAVSVINTLDSIDGLRNKAMIKWVNDVIVSGCKISGVIAQTQSQGDKITGVILGIGLNVESIPFVEPTPFAPCATSILNESRRQDKVNRAFVFDRLMHFLEINYDILMDSGYLRLLEQYKNRSAVIGRKVKIYADESSVEDSPIIAEGEVIGISDDLELEIRGYLNLIREGRLAFDEQP